MALTKNKTINFNNRNVISFIFKECDFSLLKVARQAYSNVYEKYNFSNDENKIIEIPINIVFKEAINAEVLNKPTNSDEIVVKTKSTIENICNCLLPIAKMNGNRFVYKNLDLVMLVNKTLFSRLILNLSYQLLVNCKRYSAIEVVSYVENKNYIIEFTTEYLVPPDNFDFLEVIKSILLQIKSDFSYEELPSGEITFKIIMPYENIRF